MMGLVVPVSKTGISDFFADKLKGLPGSPEVIAYVVGALGKRKWEGDDLSNQSVMLAYQDASLRGDFAGFQRVGDWVLVVDCMLPDQFNGVRESVENVGRWSYYKCFRMMGQQWRVYEELADDLPKLAARVRKRLV